MASPGEEIRGLRLKKIETLRERGGDPFPASSSFAVQDIEKIKNSFDKYESIKKIVGIAGRIMAKRGHGGSTFFDLNDGTGKLQIFLSSDEIGGDLYYNEAIEMLDIGDFAAFSGIAFYTKRSEPTINANKWQLLSKSINPLPEKWHGLSDVEERFRKRYLDILMNEDVRNRFLLRSKLVSSIRTFLGKERFVEVETPILQLLYGGALAEPFVTHHNMLDIDMYLRIAPELYLKRLLVGGLPKVFEIGKSFRNEGLDATHNPEFTTIELYEAYRDAKDGKKLVGRILNTLLKKVNRSLTLLYEGNKITFPVPSKIPQKAFWDVIDEYAGTKKSEKMSRDELASTAKQHGIIVELHESKGKIADEIFKKVCRSKMIQPVFVINYPVEISPLAKATKKGKNLVDRFQLVIGGIELVNGFSELNDPEEQRARFLLQEDLRKAGNKETQQIDEDFIEALSYGMPPAVGFAISIDRLTMLLSDTHNIKEVILFPTMKKK